MSTPLLRVVASRRKWRTANGDVPILAVTNGRSTIYVGGADLTYLADALADVMTARIQQHTEQQDGTGREVTA